MNLKPENIFLLLMVVADFSRTIWTFDSKCPPLNLVSGRSRYRWRGRSVRFNCMKGFQLVGVKYATCMNGKWDAEVPICVKYGCQPPKTVHVNGQFIESYRGAVVKIVCNPGYTLVGSSSVYCDGIRWNETFPVCRVTNKNPALSCDFEDQDLCGWSQDPMHDFDWKRQNGSTPSGDAGTGPMFDHTKGENNTGYYMYMESSSPRIKNDIARLYSPVYPPEYSNGSCFKFWYHMYGATTGFLKVYVKPEDMELYNLIPSFWINGEQGKSWIQSFFLIEPMKSPFQIVIEGVRGSGAAGDTAFDDVQLTSADECKVLEEMTSSTEFFSSVTLDDDATDFFSCKNRCSQGKPNATAEDDKCSCYETCDRDGTCCSDYFDICSIFPSTTPTAQTEVKISSTIPSSPSTDPSFQPDERLPFSKPSPRSPPPVNFNNESNEIEPKKPDLQKPLRNLPDRNSNEIPKLVFTTTPRATQKTTTPKVSHVKTGKDTKPATAISAKKAIQWEIPKVEKKLIIPPTSKTKVEKAPVNSFNEIPREKGTESKIVANGKSEEKAEVLKRTSVTSSIPTTTAKVFNSSKPNNIKLSFMEKPSSPNLSNKTWFIKGKQKDLSGKESPQAIKIDKKQENGGINIRGTIEVGSTAVAILVIIILGVFWYKRRENRKTERENMVEDSDSIVYGMNSSTPVGESYSLVCIRPGSLQRAL